MAGAALCAISGIPLEVKGSAHCHKDVYKHLKSHSRCSACPSKSGSRASLGGLPLGQMLHRSCPPCSYGLGGGLSIRLPFFSDGGRAVLRETTCACFPVPAVSLRASLCGHLHCAVYSILRGTQEPADSWVLRVPGARCVQAPHVWALRDYEARTKRRQRGHEVLGWRDGANLNS